MLTIPLHTMAAERKAIQITRPSARKLASNRSRAWTTGGVDVRVSARARRVRRYGISRGFARFPPCELRFLIPEFQEVKDNLSKETLPSCDHSATALDCVPASDNWNLAHYSLRLLRTL